jgi:hypothetical protein
MLKKLSLACIALLSGTSAFAQQTITTNYGSPVTITAANGCQITGITTLTYDGASAITTNGSGGSCSSTNPPPTVASVTLSISSSSYTLGSGAAAPVINVTNNTAAAQVVCTLNPTNGFTVSPSSVTNSGTFTLSTPAAVTTATNYSFTPTCTTSTTGYTGVTVAPQSVSLTVNPASNGGGGGGGTCNSGQVSSAVGGKTLQRLCAGEMSVQPGPVAGYNSAFTDLGVVLNGTSFPTYAYSGYSPTYTIPSGYYIALAFTPSRSGGFQLSANGSYGDGGTISVSTQPGSITQGSPGFVCGMARGGSNGLYISTAGGVCTVTVGQTYYLNLADVDANGNFLCYNGRPGTCTSSLVSYTMYAGN